VTLENRVDVSVVIPLFNKKEVVVRAINSALSQEFKPIEIIVVDDGSTDNSVDVLSVCQSELVRIIRQKNQGVSAARNRGITEALGSHIAFLDADDSWDPTFLSTLVGLISRFPNAGAYATGYWVVNAGKERRCCKFSSVPISVSGGIIENYFKSLALGANPVWSSAVCIPVKTFEVLGKFKQNLRLYEDLHMWMRIASCFQIAFSVNPRSTYFRDAENRACQKVHHSDSADALKRLVDAMVGQGVLGGKQAFYARKIVNKYAFLTSFKAIVAGECLQARRELVNVKIFSFFDMARFALIYTLSLLPNSIVMVVHSAGKALKHLYSK